MLHWLRNTDSPRDSLWLQLLTFRKIMNNQITFLLFILFPTNHCSHIWGNYCVLPVQKLTLYRQNILIFGYLRWYWRRFGKRQFQRQGIKTSVLGMFYIKKKKTTSQLRIGLSLPLILLLLYPRASFFSFFSTPSVHMAGHGLIQNTSFMYFSFTQYTFFSYFWLQIVKYFKLHCISLIVFPEKDSD